MDKGSSKPNMKVEWNIKYLTIAVYSFIVICLSILFYLIASDYSVFSKNMGRYVNTLQPIIIGASMAYLFNFILEFFEKKLINPILSKKTKLRYRRALGIILTYVVVFALIYIFVSILFPQLVSSVMRFVNELTNNFDSIYAWVIGMIERLEIRQEYLDYIVDWWNGFFDNILGFVTDLIPIIGNIVRIILSSIWNIVLGIIVSIYLLADKERFKALSKKVTYSIFSEKRANRTIELTRRADTIFGRFLSGKILDSFIIGVLTYFTLRFFNMPFVTLVSFIIGITNIIPFFGPFIGMVPSFFIILIVSPIQAFWFLLIIFVIQQIDGNIIGPKILGDSLGISAFWILFSLLIAGKLLGFIGLIIGVPLFVFVYSIIKDNVELRLQKKGLPVETKEYL